MSAQTRTKWFHGFGSAIITGLSTTFLSALGIEGAQTVGIQVASLEPGQLLSITLTGGLVGMAAYLRQSPLPPLE
jgi:hypothetical protein